MTSSPAATSLSAYEAIGGRPAVNRVVGRFYDLMDREPAYAALRAMHATDLSPMRGSLAGFLTAWLGGPTDWFAEHPNTCVMSAHGRLPITEATARQWIDAMDQALRDTDIDPNLAARIMVRLGPMALAMVKADMRASA